MGQSSVASALVVTLVAGAGVGGFSLLGSSIENSVAGSVVSSASVFDARSADPLIGSNTQAGISSALRKASKVASEFSEVSKRVDDSFQSLQRVVRERPYYQRPPRSFELPPVSEPDLTRIREVMSAHAIALLDDKADLATRLDTQLTYWDVLEELGDANRAFALTTFSRIVDEVDVRFSFARQFHKSDELRTKLAEMGIGEQFDEVSDLELVEAVGETLVPMTPRKVKDDPRVASWFERFNALREPTDETLARRVMGDTQRAQFDELDANLRSLIGRYEQLEAEAKNLDTIQRFAKIASAYDEATQDKLWRKIILPRYSREFTQALEVSSEQAFVLHGPPGTGKTYLAKEIAELLTTEDRVRFVEGAEMNGPYVGQAEKAMRELFQEATKKGTAENPYVIIFDELDGVIPNDPNSGGNAARRSAFLSGMDKALKDNPNILIFGATNNLASLDIALRRPGRFGDEIFIGAPAKEGRFNVLSDIFENLPHELDVDEVANFLEGLTFADIQAVVSSAKQAVLEVSDEAGKLRPIRMSDIRAARKDYVPTMLRQNDLQIRPVRWDQIAGQDAVIERIKEDVILPLTRPELFENVGAEAKPKSVLLHGPPGTGKTLLAAALAGEADVNIITALASNLRTPKQVAELFGRARNAKPAVIFIDELEAIAPRRAGGINPVVNQLLTEMDGLGDGASDIIVIGTTNYKSSIDEAVLRPGRLESHYYVGLPDEAGRRAVFDVHTRKQNLADGQNTAPDFDDLARRTEGYTPADIRALAERAALEAAKREASSINRADYEKALARVKPSLSPEQLQQYGQVSTKKKNDFKIGFQPSQSAAR